MDGLQEQMDANIWNLVSDVCQNTRPAIAVRVHLLDLMVKTMQEVSASRKGHVHKHSFPVNVPYKLQSSIHLQIHHPIISYPSETLGRVWIISINNGIYVYMGVSENNGTPKSSILIGFSIINHPFWGTPIFGNIHILYVSQWYILPSLAPLPISCHVTNFCRSSALRSSAWRPPEVPDRITSAHQVDE